MSQTLGTEATLISYLMEVGWELHITDNPNLPIKLIKCETEGRVTHVKTCDVSSDTVIELQMAKRLKQKKKFSVQHVRTTVYVLKATRK